MKIIELAKLENKLHGYIKRLEAQIAIAPDDNCKIALSTTEASEIHELFVDYRDMILSVMNTVYVDIW